MSYFFKMSNALIITSLLLFSACSSTEKKQVQKETPLLNVKTITLKKEAVPIWKRYTGMTKASSDQDVKTRVAGILEVVYFQDGSMSKKGKNFLRFNKMSILQILMQLRQKKLKMKPLFPWL